MARSTPKRTTFRSRRRGAGPTLVQRSRRVSAGEKAYYHQEAGAGRSAVLRPFLGFDDSDEAAILARLESGIDAVVRRT